MALGAAIAPAATHPNAAARGTVVGETGATSPQSKTIASRRGKSGEDAVRIITVAMRHPGAMIKVLARRRSPSATARCAGSKRR
ncbi:hypothetical protein MGN01_40310 [Methylobacterium gnaphalii]|uniref:Uncharacterized protein n=1 Tax=Methylobacterium gnaphalii TaxID=1010610 RepID=A0A512JQE9_9HYPH|nr:hypothetical protein MGN01_40310 [Methylobacterium gnaphalii]GLS51308.1 hypothetical protein GCM10007885_41630 [Methylobacterium gnaphalii]